jgi:amino acid transporter
MADSAQRGPRLEPESKLPRTVGERIWDAILGKPRDFLDPSLSHKLSLAAFLAWVGLGVDGLSSSAYGPDEAFRALGQHGYLAIFLAFATAFTIFVISFAYSKVIEHFPHGGGGYMVATQLLGKPAGVVSGCALVVDYVLTITVSIAGGGDAVFSLLPLSYQIYKLPTELVTIVILIVMNLRGLKESIKTVLPFFMLFVVTHFVLIVGGISSHVTAVPELIRSTHESVQSGISQFGFWGLCLILLKAYSIGGGTYTGIEAVSNGVATMREPKVETGKRTMVYLAISLGFTAFGLLICYMLFGVKPVEGQTLNAVLVRQFAETWNVFGFPVGKAFVAITMFSESVLLWIAAQTGFIDGPRVMANMALDSWMPKRFATLSDRFTIQNGIRVMGLAAIGTLFFTRGNIAILIVMYSINVFITFSLTELSMIRFTFRSRTTDKSWKANLMVHTTGFVLCFTILWIMIIEKFAEGAWATMVITGIALLGCIGIRRHYRAVAKRIRSIEERIEDIVESSLSRPPSEFDVQKPTAVILVGGSNRLGMRSVLSTLRSFPNTFHNLFFISVGLINSEFFKEGGATRLEEQTKEMLDSYVQMAKKLGYPARYALRLGTDVVWEASDLCVEVAKQIPHSVFFAGEIVFKQPHWFDRILHNDTSISIQRHIRFAGLPMVILPLVIEN